MIIRTTPPTAPVRASFTHTVGDVSPHPPPASKPPGVVAATGDQTAAIATMNAANRKFWRREGPGGRHAKLVPVKAGKG